MYLVHYCSSPKVLQLNSSCVTISSTELFLGQFNLKMFQERIK